MLENAAALVAAGTAGRRNSRVPPPPLARPVLTTESWHSTGLVESPLPSRRLAADPGLVRQPIRTEQSRRGLERPDCQAGQHSSKEERNLLTLARSTATRTFDQPLWRSTVNSRGNYRQPSIFFAGKFLPAWRPGNHSREAAWPTAARVTWTLIIGVDWSMAGRASDLHSFPLYNQVICVWRH